MKSKLIEMREKFPQTELWTDSFHVDHHVYGLTQGITGITTSPTWVSRMMCDEPADGHIDVVRKIQREHPEYSVHETAWAWTLRMGEERSKVLLPLWEEGNPKAGRFAIQTSIYDYNNFERMVQMALDVDACGPNMQVKIPSTSVGIRAMEEATYLGVSVMATLCFSVDQAVAAAEAIRRGMVRRSAEGFSNQNLNPVCAVLLGMQDDWLKNYADANNLVLPPDVFNWGGVAICKKIHKVFKERGYETKILVAYYRHQLHWSEFIGGDLVMTIPAKWQKRFAECDVEIKDSMQVPVNEAILSQLNRLHPFTLAYTEGSIDANSFDQFGPVVLTLKYFMDEYEKAVSKIKEILLPNPLP